MAGQANRRVLLKLSGEALQGGRAGGIDFETVGRFCDEIRDARAAGTEIGVVVGGGNIVRGSDAAKLGLDKPTGDYMGMLATVINALAIQAGLEQRGVTTRVLTAIEMRGVAEPFIRRRALRHLEKGRVVIFGAGTGNPFFTTDTAAALRAKEINASVLLKATKVDGVYSEDPKKNPNATRYATLTYNQALQENLGVMDASAIALCRENRLPILVFDMTHPGNVVRAVRGDAIGTIVKGD